MGASVHCGAGGLAGPGVRPGARAQLGQAGATGHVAHGVGINPALDRRLRVEHVALALLEEAITTLMTNCAPLLGVRIGQAYITASANYLDVILYHSVVVFVPLFIGWAVLLWRWRFTPFAVFVLFGITGTLAEASAFGPQSLANFGLWIFVYGLVVWLPAHWVPPERSARVPRWWAYPLATVAPFLFLPLLFLLAPWLWLTAKHSSIHFPAIH